MSRIILALAAAAAAYAQQYTASTAAGGAPPATPAAATTTSIGQPNRTTTDAAGNFYFSSANAVFRVGSSGNLTLVAGNSRAGFSGDGGPAVNAQLNNPQGLAIDSAGNIYICDAGNNRVRMVSPAGVITTFAGTGAISPGGPRTYNDGGPATNALLHLPSGIAIDKNANVYIADTADNSIRLVTPDGIINNFAGDSFPGWAGDNGTPDTNHPSISGSGNAVDAELHGPCDVTVDGSGTVYVADTGNAAIRKITTDGKIVTIAGTGVASFSGDGGDASSAGLYTPISLVLDSSGNIYILTNGDSRIRKIDTKGIITTIAGTGQAGFAGDGSAATGAQMNFPTGLAIDSSSNLYIADAVNLRVRKIAGANISTVAGSGVLSYSGDTRSPLLAQLNAPNAVAIAQPSSTSTVLYIADTGNNVVRSVISPLVGPGPSGQIILTYAGNGQPGFGGDGGAASSAQLNAPQGITAAPYAQAGSIQVAGTVYIADTGNNRIRAVASNGVISTYAGSGTAGFGGDGGAAGSAQLYTPTGLAVDSSNNLYIADYNNNRIRRVSNTGVITTVAGNGSQGFSGDGGPAVNARLNLPQAVAVDAAGNLYIADSGNNRIRLVTPNGIITTVGGTGMPGFSGDGGSPLAANIGNPSGIAVDSSGALYITDGSSRIRKIYPTGVISTIAGSGALGYSGDGGPASSATFNGPIGLALDPNNNVYVADSGNNAVRSLNFAGFNVSLNAVTNGASNQAGSIAPGEIVVLYGTGLGAAGLNQAALNASGVIGTSLAGTTVFFNNFPSPVLYTTPNQVGAIVPYGITGSQAQVSVQFQSQLSGTTTVPVVASAPAVFTLSGAGSGAAVAFDAQTGVLNDAANPAKPGSFVTIYVTGEGQTNPTGTNGKPGAVPLPLPVLPVSATIAGKPATVQFAGGAPAIVAGVMQVNLQVPSGLGTAAVPVLVKVGDATSPSGVTIFVSEN
jgi:uncharacterized protein (TIGR03437 family)